MRSSRCERGSPRDGALRAEPSGVSRPALRSALLGLAIALLVLAAGIASYELSAPGRPSAPAAARGHGFRSAGLLSLPSGAQAPVSQALGAEDPAYFVDDSASGLRAQSPRGALRSSFTSAGVSVSSGSAHLAMRLTGVGYGAQLAAIAPAVPRAHANRVSYAHPGVSEWYVNGPLGLEQGFTIARAPSGRLSAPLTLAIALSGDARASLEQGGQAIAFTRAGRTVLRYTGLTARDARGRTLHSWLTLEQGQVSIHVDARGARYPLRIDPFVQQGGKLTGGKEEVGAGSFGYSVALSADGGTALVGADQDHGGIGAAWVFTRSGESWSQQGGKLTAGKEETGKDDFGSGVALSANGNTALVGGAGEAWVFTRTGDTWSSAEKLPAVEKFYPLGTVALSEDGDIAVLGGDCEHLHHFVCAWAFARTKGTWSQQGEEMSGLGEEVNLQYTPAVALSGNGTTVLLGTYAEGSKGGGGSPGGVWVFVRSGEKWSQQGEMLLSKEESSEADFGQSVALSSEGNTALIGAPQDLGNTGAAWVYVRTGETWSQQGGKLTGEEEVGKDVFFGDSVALSADGNTALIGGPGDDSVVGAAWAFARSGGKWSQQGAKLTGKLTSGDAAFGASVALSGTGATALIGGGGDSSGRGAVWVYQSVLAPAVHTGGASSLTQSEATVNATVNPQGGEVTACKLEYGTTTAYGSSAVCSPSPGSGESPVAVSAALTGLAEDTTYHFRVSATNAGGTNVGADETFTTFANSNSKSNTSPSEPAEVEDGPVSATASGGTGTVTVGQYGSNAGGVGLLGGVGETVDVYQSASSSFSKIEYADCELHGGRTLYWFNPQAHGETGEWQLVTRQSYVAGSPSCIDAVAEASGTSPTVTQMTGTRFKAAASFEAPEFGRCAEVTENTETKRYEGFFTAKTCLSKGTEGLQGEPLSKYEWYLDVLEEEPNQPAVHFTLTPSAAKLETSEKAFKITCTGGSGTGEYTGPKTIGDIALTFTGCSQAGQECASAGAGQKEIRTSTLEGELGWEAKPSKVGLELHPDSGAFMAFTCGSTAISVTGGVIAPMKANKATSAPTLKFKGAKGAQKPEGFEGQKSILEASEAAGASKPMSLSVTLAQENENGEQAAINTAY